MQAGEKRRIEAATDEPRVAQERGMATSRPRAEGPRASRRSACVRVGVYQKPGARGQPVMCRAYFGGAGGRYPCAASRCPAAA